MQETVKLGQLLTGGEQRDAVHVAIAPVVAGHTLNPGDHVGFTMGNDGRNQTVVTRGCDPIGIVDPFLLEQIKPGQRCYLFLYPNTVTSLRHSWTHPAFEPQLPSVEQVIAGERGERFADSKKWIAEIAERFGLDYEGMMAAAKEYLNGWGHVTQYGSERWRNTFPDYAEEFWRHYEIITGETVKERNANFFSCSC